MFSMSEAPAPAPDCVCWGCSKPQLPGDQPFRQCVTCQLAGRVTGFFCSRACQKANAKPHAQWHVEQEKEDARSARASRESSAKAPAQARPLADAAELRRDYVKAARKARKAIAADPSRGMPHNELGAALERMEDYVGAMRSYLQASERYAEGSSLWALSIASAFAMLLRPECNAPAVRPSWASGPELLSLSERVLAIEPGVQRAVLMRAHVLSQSRFITSVDWTVVDRGTVEQANAKLLEAGRCFQKAAQLATTRTKKEHFVM